MTFLVLLACCGVAVWRPIWGIAVLLVATSSLFHLHRYATVSLGVGYAGIWDVFLLVLLVAAWRDRVAYLGAVPEAEAGTVGGEDDEGAARARIATAFSRSTLVSALAPLLVWQTICSARGFFYWHDSPLLNYVLRNFLLAVVPWSLVATVWLLRHRRDEILRVVVAVAVGTGVVHLALQVLDYRPLMDAAYWYYVPETEYLRDLREQWVDSNEFVRGSPQGILLMTYVAIMGFASYVGATRLHPLRLSVSALLMVAVLITLTRALLVSLVVGCATACLLWLVSSLHRSGHNLLQRYHRIALAGCAIVAAVLIMAMAKPNFVEAWVERLDALRVESDFLSESSDTIRGDDNSASIRAIADSPIFGWGIARYPERYSIRDAPPDNIQPLLMLALAGGVLNVLLAIRVLALVLVRFLRASFADLDLFDRLVPGFALLVVMFVLNLTGGGGFINGTFQGTTLIVSAILIGLMAAEYAGYYERTQVVAARVRIPGERSLRAPVVVGVLLAVWAVSAVPAGAQTPRTYYVSRSSGNDARTGLQTNAAWRTLARLRTAPLQPGDTVLLRRGDWWRETLTIPAGGTADGRITIGAYGIGARPNIRGSDVPVGWSAWSSTVWQAQLAQAPTAVYFDGQRGTRMTHIGEVVAARQWWADGARLYVYSNGLPSNAYRSPGVEAAVRPDVVLIGIRSYVTVRGIEARHAADPASAGFRVYRSEHVRLEDCVARENVGQGILGGGTGPYSNNLAVDGCEVTDNGRTGISITVGRDMGARGTEIARSLVARNGWAQAGFAHGIFGSFEDGRIIDNTIENNGDGNPAFEHGIYVYAFPGQRDPFTIADNRIRGHRFGNGIKVVDASGTVTRNQVVDNAYDGVGCHDALTNGYTLTISYNVLARNHSGIREDFASAAGKTLVIYNNTLFANPLVVISANLRSLSIRNNIIVASGNFAYEMEQQSVAEIDYNVVVTAHPTRVAWYGRTPRDLSYWQQAIGFDRHGVTSDPMFTDPANDDFSLRPGSPAIDAGVSIDAAGVLDFRHESSPVGAAQDIGALEYRP